MWIRSLHCIVQLLKCLWLFVTSRTAAHLGSLSFTISGSLLKLTSIESVMLSNQFILCHLLSSCPQSFPESGFCFVFSPISGLFVSGGQSIGVSVSASILPMNLQDWFCLGLTGCISLQSKGFWRVFSSPTIQKHQFFSSTQPSLWSKCTPDYWKNYSFD